jgi:hypothetical protein
MKLKISQSKLTTLAQTAVDNTLMTIKNESEDWGMGEMSELVQVDGVERIEVVKVEKKGNPFKIDVIFYVNDDGIYYSELIEEISARVDQDWIPNSYIHVIEFIKI